MPIPKGFEEDPRRLGPMMTPAALESVAKDLYEEVCCGTRELWPIDSERFEQSHESRDQVHFHC